MFPLSFEQEAIWLADQVDKRGSAYNMRFAVTLDGLLDIEALKRSVSRVVERHASLRTRIVLSDDVPLQVVDNVDVALPIIPIEGADTASKLRRALELTQEIADTPFVLERESGLRMRLFVLGATKHLLLVVLHHVVGDGWSQGILLRDLAAFYNADVTGTEVPTPLSLQYHDYSTRQHAQLTQAVFDPLLVRWREHLANAPGRLNFHPSISGKRGGGRFVFELDAALLRGVEALSRDERATPFMTFLAAWAVLVARRSGQFDVIVGSPIGNRLQRDTEALVGCFVNSLPFRIAIDPNLGFRAHMARVRATALDVFEIQAVPQARLLAELRGDGAPVLSQTMFVLNALPGAPPRFAGLTTERAEIPRHGATRYDIALSLSGRRAELEYNADLFDEATIGAIAGHFTNLVTDALARPDQPVGQLALLAPQEREQLRRWNETERSYPDPSFVHELFSAQVDRTPDAAAVTFEETSLTYRELDERANRLAHHLRSVGAHADEPIGVCLERSLDLIVTLLAILKAGAPYMPIDPTYPPLRARSIVDDSKCKLVVGHSTSSSLFLNTDVECIWLDKLRDEIAARPTTRPNIIVDGQNAAYVIFTSGSTGRPKGAVLTHEGLRNRLLWMQEAFALGDGDVLLQKTQFTFDVSVWEFFWAFLVGARLVVARPEGHRDPGYLADLIRKQGVTIVHFVPSMLGPFVEAVRHAPCETLRAVICSGEALTGSHQRTFGEVLHAELHNLYGPTEATVDVSWWRCDPTVDETSVPIGYPIANTKLYVLDRERQLVPVGVVGQLFISGVQLARGYSGRPDLTAERFVPNPYVAGERMYATGDLARYRSGGAIEYLGRIDDQVKIRGFRIELGEIEAVLARYQGVREAVVLAREDHPGDKQLVAYLVGAQATRPSTGELGDWLLQHLPAYMVPVAYVWLDALPVTANGKLDRRALPAPGSSDDSTSDDSTYVAPRDEAETKLAMLCAEVLRRPRVGMNDNFFVLGGHSMLAVRLVTRIRSTFGVGVPLHEILAQKNISGIARAVAQCVALGSSQPTSEASGDPMSGPLVPAQEWTYRNHLACPVPIHNMRLYKRLLGPLDAHSFVRALREIVRRHGTLRTVYSATEPFTQRVLPADSVSISVRELTVPEAERDQELIRIGDAGYRQIYDLGVRCFRVELIRFSPDDHALMVWCHSVAWDADSGSVFLRELRELYPAFAAGKPSPLMDLEISYLEFARRQRKHLTDERLEEAREYWRARIADAPVLELPGDLPRKPGLLGSPSRMIPLLVPRELVERVHKFAQAEGATPYMVYLAAYFALLHRETMERDLLIAFPTSLRAEPGTSAMIGCLNTTGLYRLQLAPGESRRVFLGRVREHVLDTMRYAEIHWAESWPRGKSVMTSKVPYSAIISYMGAEEEEITIPGLRLQDVPRGEGQVWVDMVLYAYETAKGLEGGIMYRADVFRRETAERFALHFEREVNEMVDQPHQPIVNQ